MRRVYTALMVQVNRNIGWDINDHYYIGAKQEQGGSPFLQGPNGPEIPLTGPFWADGQPDGGANENCVVFRIVDGVGKLFDWDCDLKQPYMCQILLIGDPAE